MSCHELGGYVFSKKIYLFFIFLNFCHTNNIEQRPNYKRKEPYDGNHIKL